MKHLLGTAALLLVLAGAAGIVSFRLGTKSEVSDALARRDALAWLRTDFQLDDAQFAAIRKLHESYSLVCEEHCRAIQEAIAGRNALKTSGRAGAGAIADAEKRVQELRRICETAIEAHVREVAAHMSPAQAQRYLALVLPKISDFDHQAPPDIRLNAHH